MALEEYGVRLKVTADTADAKEKLDELIDEKSRRVQDAVQALDGGGARPARPASPSAPASSGAADPGLRRSGRDFGKGFSEEVARGAAGKAIGKAFAGFVLHQGIGTAFSFARTAGGDNLAVDRAQSLASGALQFGTMGAMMGGPVGAAVGALVGGISGLASQLGREREQRQQTRMGMWQTVYQGNQQTLSGLGAIAQRRLLDWQGSRENRIDWLAHNREDLRARRNDASRRLADFGGDTSSAEYQVLQGEFQRLNGQYNAALSEEMQERMTPLRELYDAGDFADALSKRGLSVGPTVDVGSANEKVIEQQEKMVGLLQKIVDQANAGAGSTGAGLNGILHDIIDQTVLR